MLDFVFWHESMVEQAQGSRQLSFFAQAKAIGAVAERLQHWPVDQRLRLKGFAAPRAAARPRFQAAARPVSGLMFHVTDFTSGETV